MSETLLTPSLSNRDGRLYIGEWDAAELANTYGTPLVVMDEDLIRKNCRTYADSIRKYYGGNGLVCYASKAFCCKQIYRIVREEGLGTDCVSLGELATALSTGFDPADICYHGNNKTKKELKTILSEGVGRIVCDHLDELHMLDKLAAEMKVTPNVLLRITPGISAHTHAFISTGQSDSKFGFALDEGFALEAARCAHSLQHINFTGLHCHIGSQIFDVDPFELAAKVMIDFMAKLQDEGIVLKELDLGGGFGIRYTREENPVAYDAYMGRVADVIHTHAKEKGIDPPFILLEPGRSLVGEAGTTLYEVGFAKTVPGGKQYLAVDGGMTDNIRPALYQAEYTFYAAEKMDEPQDKHYTIAGRNCESGDLLGECDLPQMNYGDILAVASTGAYCYAMSSNYNRTPRPGVLFVSQNEMYMGIQPETVEQMLERDL